MKKHELLKEAYDKFPKGQKFSPITGEAKTVIILTSSGKFQLLSDSSVIDENSGTYIYHRGVWAIPIKSEDKYSGKKVAVRVNNLTEHNTLMNFMKRPNATGRSLFPVFHYVNKVGFDVCLEALNGHTIVDFKEYAEDNCLPFTPYEDEKPVLFTTEDGVQLRENDHFFLVDKGIKHWIFNKGYRFAKADKPLDPEKQKAFRNGAAADKWIFEQNAIINGLTKDESEDCLIIEAENGYLLFEGDEYWRAYLHKSEKPTQPSRWYIDHCENLTRKSAVVTTPEEAKAFVKKESAEEHCDLMNKPATLDYPAYADKMDRKIVQDIIDTGVWSSWSNKELAYVEPEPKSEPEPCFKINLGDENKEVRVFKDRVQFRVNTIHLTVNGSDFRKIIESFQLIQ